MTSTSPANSTALEWDQVRASFTSSLLVDTALSSLAQNLDGLAWPLTGPDETAAAYIDFSYDELRLELSARGHPSAASLLVRILRETLAFDQPFGDMVQQAAATAERDNALLQTLTRLGIPENFPITLTGLDHSALELCRLECVCTLGEFALFAQTLSQNVIVGGHLRDLLNALAHVDGGALARFLPFRPGASGLHLAEALALAVRHPKPAAQVELTLDWFAAEFAEWRQRARDDRRFLARQFVHIDDLETEERISDFLAPHLKTSTAPGGAWSALTRWLRR